MKFSFLRCLALLSFVSLSTTTSAENHVEQPEEGAVRYGSDECNNGPEYLSDNDIVCAAVFSDTSVADYLNGLPRRIPLSMFAELNPRLGTVDRDTLIKGITILRVR